MLTRQLRPSIRPARPQRRVAPTSALFGFMGGSSSKPSTTMSNFHQLSALDIDKKKVHSLRARAFVLTCQRLCGRVSFGFQHLLFTNFHLWAYRLTSRACRAG